MRLFKNLPIIFISVLLTFSIVESAEDSSDMLYKKAADKYHSLLRFGKGLPRENWMESLKLFSKVYTKYPTGKKSSEALYMTGKIYKELYSRFKSGDDKENAVAIFRILIKSHSESSLADDALFLTGEIYRLDRDYTNALSSYKGLLRWFPNGDMVGKAKDKISEIDAKFVEDKAVIPVNIEESRSGKVNIYSKLKSVRFWSSENYARVVFDISKMVNYRISRLREENKLTIDLLGTNIGRDAGMGVIKEKGIIKSITVSEPEGDITRIEVTLKKEHDINSMEQRDPNRIVIDIYGKEAPKEVGVKSTTPLIAEMDKPAPQLNDTVAKGTKAKASAQLGVPVKVVPVVEKMVLSSKGRVSSVSALAKMAVKATSIVAKASIVIPKKHTAVEKNNKALIEAGLIKAKSKGKKQKSKKRVTIAKAPKPVHRRGGFAGVRTIVVDAGHGGKDPGAMSKSGLKEKVITLDIAKRLARILKRECRCKIVLTRKKDVYISLNQRTAIANSVNADLFVSVHVNAATNGRANGIETFFLSPARSRRAMLIAARENMVKMRKSSAGMDDINFIFSDMVNTDKINQSNKMAGSVQNSLVHTVNGRYKTKNLGVKRAMFYVLHGARMPSVLVEVGFISNRKEEKRLKSRTWRQRVAQGIALGVKRYSRSARVASR